MELLDQLSTIFELVWRKSLLNGATESRTCESGFKLVEKH